MTKAGGSLEVRRIRVDGPDLVRAAGGAFKQGVGGAGAVASYVSDHRRAHGISPVQDGERDLAFVDGAGGAAHLRAEGQCLISDGAEGRLRPVDVVLVAAGLTVRKWRISVEGR